jgi:hypothetical protein
MILPNENPKLKCLASRFVDFRNKCSQHELSTAQVNRGQLLAAALCAPYSPSQPSWVQCQTSFYQAWNPAARLSPLTRLISHWEAEAARMEVLASQQMWGCQEMGAPPRAWRRATFMVIPLAPSPGHRRDRWWGLSQAYLHILSTGKEINTTVTWFSG